MDIQELVDKLQQDGIAKGQEEADRLVLQAKEQAQEILQNAHLEEKRILEQAQKEANGMLENAKNNVQLAVRDILLQLQNQIQSTFQQLLCKATGKVLSDGQIVQNILTALIDSYQKQHGSQIVHLELSEALRQNLREWLVEKYKAEMKGNPKLYGFLLQDKDGGQIEITPESVQEALLPFISPFVRDLLPKK